MTFELLKYEWLRPLEDGSIAPKHVGVLIRDMFGKKVPSGYQKTKIYFQNALFLSDSPYLELLFYVVSTIIRAFIISGYQFLYFLFAELGRL
jgi:hypothetical protein